MDKQSSTINEDSEPKVVVVLSGLVKASIVGSFVIWIFGVLYFAQSFLLPVMLAFLLALIFSPIVRTLRRRGIHEGITASLVVILLGLAVVGSILTLSEPVANWTNNIPGMGLELKQKLSSLRKPVDKLKEVEKQVEEATSRQPESDVQEVVVKEPGLLSKAASGAPDIIAGIGLTLVLLLFILASGDMFYEKLVRVLPTLTDKKRGLTIARDIEREVSRYLLTISVINAGLGLLVGIVPRQH